MTFSFPHCGLIPVLALLFSGCLFSRQQEPTELFPADSLSRTVASALVVDSLVYLGKMDSTTTAGRYINTLQSDSSGVLYATDLLSSEVLTLTEGGAVTATVKDTMLTYPYLVGMRDGAVAVFSAGTGVVRFIREGRVVDSQRLPEFTSVGALSAYAVVDETRSYFKHVNPPDSTYFLDLENPNAERVKMAGPGWRHRGVMRFWNDRLLSFSAYRPVVEVLTTTGQPDTLALVGFDSPMLARSRAFVLGEEDDAPLLISSAKVVGDHLYVLNLRPGIIRVDVYDETGHIRHILEYAEQGLLSYTPQDLAVWEVPDGPVHITVASVETVYQMVSLQYVSRLDRFVWTRGEQK